MVGNVIRVCKNQHVIIGRCGIAGVNSYKHLPMPCPIYPINHNRCIAVDCFNKKPFNLFYGFKFSVETDNLKIAEYKQNGYPSIDFVIDAISSVLKEDRELEDKYNKQIKLSDTSIEQLSEEISEIWNGEETAKQYDANGWYTGNPQDAIVPEQDADDL